MTAPLHVTPSAKHPRDLPQLSPLRAVPPLAVQLPVAVRRLPLAQPLPSAGAARQPLAQPLPLAGAAVRQPLAQPLPSVEAARQPRLQKSQHAASPLQPYHPSEGYALLPLMRALLQALALALARPPHQLRPLGPSICEVLLTAAATCH